MYKVVLIDDEPLARQLIGTLLNPYDEIKVVAECGDGFEGFKTIQELQPDLIFLDIQMPRVTGFEMLELLEEPPSVIFTTAFDEYALKAFESNAIDYLLKPITKERLDKAIKKWLQTARQTKAANLQELMEKSVPEGYKNRIVVKDNGLLRIIREQEIYYVEASDDYVKIFTREGKYLKKSTLSYIEKTLDPKRFVRVHRSFLIPVEQLMRIEPYEKESHIALLQGGVKIPVSKSGFSKLKEMLGW